MSKNPDRYIVGAQKNPDGTIDYSRAALMHLPTIEEPNTPHFSERQLRQWAAQLKTMTERGKKVFLRQTAKRNQTSVELLLAEIRKFTKEQIRNKEQGNIRHYHRTSIDTLARIAQSGSLLSRSKLQERDPDIHIPGWSASDDVMMTRDYFDTEGNLIQPGFAEQEVVGASSNGVILVFAESIFDRDDYDATGIYPTISELGLREHTEAILIESESDRERVQVILLAHDLTIPIQLKEEWYSSLDKKKHES